MARPIGTDKWIHFGDTRYQHFFDRIGMYSNLNHNDLTRRKNYRKRHKSIVDKDGFPYYKNINSPSFYSYYYLW